MVMQAARCSRRGEDHGAESRMQAKNWYKKLGRLQNMLESSTCMVLHLVRSTTMHEEAEAGVISIVGTILG